MTRRGRLAYKIGFCLFLGSFYPVASLAVQPGSDPVGLEKQIQQIDQEIVLLRAELAKSNGNQRALSQYLEQLQAMDLLPGFQARFENLKAAASQEQAMQVSDSYEQSFKLPDAQSNVIVLLPLSGQYAAAGEAILTALKLHWPYQKPFVVLDSAIYEQMFELWELVKLYSPDFIIGPLDKRNAVAWQALHTGIPNLYLNQLAQFSASEKGLAPNKEKGLQQLASFIQQTGLQHLLILAKKNEGARKLAFEFEQAWLKSDAFMHYQVAEVGESVDQSLQDALNVTRSRSRKNWLQKNLQSDLEFEPRARQDIDAIVHFLQVDEAVQIKPLINFYHLNSSMSLWYPSVYPSRSELLSLLPSWQQTYAFIPPYLTLASEENDVENSLYGKNGLFYALGQLVAETVNNSLVLKARQHLAYSQAGELVSDHQAELQLLPSVYWLDDRQLQPVEAYQFYFQ